MTEIKTVLRFSFILISLSYLNFPIVAEENATANKREKLVAEITKELKGFEQTQKDVSAKFPFKKKVELKARIFSEMGYFFRKDRPDYDDYIKALTSSQRKDLYEYRRLLGKAVWYRQTSISNEMIEMMKTIEKYRSEDKMYLTLASFNKDLFGQPSESEINECRTLREKLGVPEPIVDYLMTYPKYQSLFD